MDEYIIKEETLTDIADAIRAKRNLNQELTPLEMAEEIMKITTGDGSGENGATFIPAIDDEGNLSWSNDKGLENPTPVNIKGPQGEPGPEGPKGADGTMSFEDLTEEQKASLKGDKGDKGDTGPQGPQGEQGVQGIQGAPGEQGPQGEQGLQGAQGIPGNDGYTPQRGVDYWTEEDKQEILNEVGDNVGFTPISNQEIDEICTYEGIFSVDGVEF